MYTKKLLKTKQTIFLTKDLQNIFEIKDPNYLYVLLNRMVKRKELIRLSKNVYTYTDDYDVWELANKLKRPSYVSLETILYKKGIISQTFDNTITSVCNTSFEKKITKTYTYQKIKDSILTSPIGIINNGHYICNTRKSNMWHALFDTKFLLGQDIKFR